jgi:nucleoside-diphosphate-sugar epimerase
MDAVTASCDRQLEPARNLHDLSIVSRVSTVGVLGATSLVGRPLLARLVESGRHALVCSRQPPTRPSPGSITWCTPGDPVTGLITRWIALCPPWATVDAFEWLVASGCQRLVALSSTSIGTKLSSPDVRERRLAERLATAEEALVTRAAQAGIRLVFLRPTMIYDGHSDGNVATIAAFVRRFGWFPLCGPARGLRQPVHADDVAAACLAALDHDAAKPAYTLSGGEALPFRDLVDRTCRAHGLPPRMIHLPRAAWRLAARVGRCLGLARDATAGTAARMNEDLSCDHADAARDLGFRPRPFLPAVAGDDTLA